MKAKVFFNLEQKNTKDIILMALFGLKWKKERRKSEERRRCEKKRWMKKGETRFGKGKQEEGN